MKKCLKIALLVMGGILLAGSIAIILGFFVMLLWNWLMPDIFGLKTITFWQAWGLVFLTKLLFHRHDHSMHHKKDIHRSKIKAKIKRWVQDEQEDELTSLS